MVSSDDSGGGSTGGSDAVPISLGQSAAASRLETLVYCSESRAYRVEYDPERTAPSNAVVQSIAAVVGRSPRELDPLYDSIDPDALDSMFGPRSTGDPRLSFDFNGYDVTLSDAAIRIERADATEE